jgi:sigma-B regulation protein RsbU (phosphoserine phosphatase)
MPRLLVESGNEAGQSYPLRTDSVTVGRSASATIQIVDKRVSRHHVLFQRYKDSYTVEDLGSKNGSLINNEVLVGRVRLKPGDRVQLGDTVLLYQESEHADDALTSRSGTGKLRFVAGEVGPALKELPVEGPAMPTAGTSQFGTSEDVVGVYNRLRVLYDVADALGREQDIAALLVAIGEIMWKALSPNRLVILCRPGMTEAIRADGSSDDRPVHSGARVGSHSLEAVMVRSDFDGDDVVNVSRSILDRAMNESIAILVSDAPSDIRFADNESIIAGRIRSCVCVPLVSRGEAIGVVYLDSQDPGPTYYTNEDLEMVTIIANQTALAIYNARLRLQDLERQKMAKELEIARDIQRNLLPQELPVVAGMELAAMSQPARQVGGDYYDFIQFEDDKLALVIADVSGKGVPAAILTASIRGSLRLESTRSAQGDVATTVSGLNKWTCLDASNNMFITLAYILYDPTARTLTFTNAGHVYPLLFKADGSTIIELEKGGCFLGIMDFLEYECETIEVAEGDILILFTDGLPDTHNADKETLGTDRIIDTVRANAHLSASEIKDELYEATMTFRGNTDQFDDLTILVAKF